MQVKTGADTVISSFMTDLGKPALDGKIGDVDASDGHQLSLLVSPQCDIE